MSKTVSVRVPASSANLGAGFDVLSLALQLHLEVRGRESSGNRIVWRGIGKSDVPLGPANLIARATQEPFNGWSRPLGGIDLEVTNAIPIGRGLGSSAAALIAGVLIGARLRGLSMTPQRLLELALPFEKHGDNLAAALYGGFCIVALENGGARINTLAWPAGWRAVVFVPASVSPTHELRRLVPTHPPIQDAVFNLGRVAQWVLAVSAADGSLLRSSMDDRLHQPGRAIAYPYLDDMIAAAEQAGALGAALSGAGGSVIAIVERNAAAVARAMDALARKRSVQGSAVTLRIAARGALT